MFAHTVRRARRDADLAGHGSQIHDRGAVAWLGGFERFGVDRWVHGAELGAHAVEDALAVDPEHEIEVVVGRVDDVAAVFAVHAGDVGGAVEVVEFLDGGCNPGVDGGDVADVEDGGRVRGAGFGFGER